MGDVHLYSHVATRRETTQCGRTFNVQSRKLHNSGSIGKSYNKRYEYKELKHN